MDVRFDSAVWQSSSHEPQQVICHNDFGPYNMVFDQEHLVGAIDFDTASPGPRMRTWRSTPMAARVTRETRPSLNTQQCMEGTLRESEN